MSSEPTFRPMSHHLDPDTPCQCGNCDWCGPLANVNEIGQDHFEQAVAPGDPCPAGECPECNCFVHLVKNYQPQEGT